MGRMLSSPTMKIGSVTMVFEDALDQGPDTTAPTNSGSIQVAGGAPKEGVKTEWDFAAKVTSTYADGLQTVTVAGTSFNIVERGKTIQFKDRSVPIEGDARTVYVSGDGSTRLEP
jgi:hypothetical protein